MSDPVSNNSKTSASDFKAAFLRLPTAGRIGVLAAAAIFVVFSFQLLLNILAGPFRSQNVGDFSIDRFATLPVQYNGREQPLESVARNTLRAISGTTTVEVEADSAEGAPAVTEMSATVWLLESVARPERADGFPIFRIDHPDVRSLFNIGPNDGKRFSFNRMQPHFETFQAEAEKVPDSDERTNYQEAIVELYGKLNLYYALSSSFHPLGGLDGLLMEYARWEMVAEDGREAVTANQQGEPFDQEVYNTFTFLANRYLELSNTATLGIMPNPDGPEQPWLNVGEGLLQTIQTGEVPDTIEAHARVTVAWRDGDPASFNEALTTLHELTDTNAQGKVFWETKFQRAEIFYNLAAFYALLTLGFAAVLIKSFEPARKVLFWTTVVVFGLHTLGIVARMYLQGYPPVTNLYSSAIFIGWAACGLGIYLERMFKLGVGGFCAGLIGYATLVIATNLYETSAAGDTLEPMRAVLNDNFWLATHVLVVTMGYVAVFLAGVLAIVYVLLRAAQRHFTPLVRRDIYRMVYGITCFGVLFSFVGTMLGGVWADQSWGRFWGWDPKENGALMIVLWGALMLHARWGGLVKERGFMLLAIGGNIVTAWSWFGTNMLEVGLHSYGFMDSAFWPLNLFWLSQILLIVLGLMPPLVHRRPAEVPTQAQPDSGGHPEPAGSPS